MNDLTTKLKNNLKLCDTCKYEVRNKEQCRTCTLGNSNWVSVLATDKEMLELLLELPTYKNVLTMFIKQQRKGINKYGHLMSTEHWTPIQCIEHAQQEAIDLIIYLETIKENLQQEEDTKHAMVSTKQ